jgi:hypothetical protein
MPPVEKVKVKPEYAAWIDATYPTRESAYGQCDEATARMVAAFPELKRVRGHYHCILWGERAHWWCVSPEGDIVDPTARQFPSRGGHYEPWQEGEPEPTGMCPECGGLCYEGASVCSDECGRAYTAYLNSAWR